MSVKISKEYVGGCRIILKILEIMEEKLKQEKNNINNFSKQLEVDMRKSESLNSDILYASRKNLQRKELCDDILTEIEYIKTSLNCILNKHNLREGVLAINYEKIAINDILKIICTLVNYNV